MSRSSLLIFTELESFLIIVLACQTLTLIPPTGSGGPQAGYSSTYERIFLAINSAQKCYHLTALLVQLRASVHANHIQYTLLEGTIIFSIDHVSLHKHTQTT